MRILQSCKILLTVQLVVYISASTLRETDSIHLQEGIHDALPTCFIQPGLPQTRFTITYLKQWASKTDHQLPEFSLKDVFPPVTSWFKTPKQFFQILITIGNDDKRGQNPQFINKVLERYFTEDRLRSLFLSKEYQDAKEFSFNNLSIPVLAQLFKMGWIHLSWFRFDDLVELERTKIMFDMNDYILLGPDVVRKFFSHRVAQDQNQAEVQHVLRQFILQEKLSWRQLTLEEIIIMDTTEQDFNKLDPRQIQDMQKRGQRLYEFWVELNFAHILKKGLLNPLKPSHYCLITNDLLEYLSQDQLDEYDKNYKGIGGQNGLKYEQLGHLTGDQLITLLAKRNKMFSQDGKDILHKFALEKRIDFTQLTPAQLVGINLPDVADAHVLTTTQIDGIRKLQSHQSDEWLKPRLSSLLQHNKFIRPLCQREFKLLNDLDLQYLSRDEIIDFDKSTRLLEAHEFEKLDVDNILKLLRRHGANRSASVRKQVVNFLVDVKQISLGSLRGNELIYLAVDDNIVHAISQNQLDEIRIMAEDGKPLAVSWLENNLPVLLEKTNIVQIHDLKNYEIMLLGKSPTSAAIGAQILRRNGIHKKSAEQVEIWIRANVLSIQDLTANQLLKYEVCKLRVQDWQSLTSHQIEVLLSDEQWRSKNFKMLLTKVKFHTAHLDLLDDEYVLEYVFYHKKWGSVSSARQKKMTQKYLLRLVPDVVHPSLSVHYDLRKLELSQQKHVKSFSIYGKETEVLMKSSFPLNADAVRSLLDDPKNGSRSAILPLLTMEDMFGFLKSEDTISSKGKSIHKYTDNVRHHLFLRIFQDRENILHDNKDAPTVYMYNETTAKFSHRRFLHECPVLHSCVEDVNFFHILEIIKANKFKYGLEEYLPVLTTKELKSLLKKPDMHFKGVSKGSNVYERIELAMHEIRHHFFLRQRALITGGHVKRMKDMTPTQQASCHKVLFFLNDIEDTHPVDLILYYVRIRHIFLHRFDDVELWSRRNKLDFLRHVHTIQLERGLNPPLQEPVVMDHEIRFVHYNQNFRSKDMDNSQIVRYDEVMPGLNGNQIAKSYERDCKIYLDWLGIDQEIEFESVSFEMMVVSSYRSKKATCDPERHPLLGMTKEYDALFLSKQQNELTSAQLKKFQRLAKFINELHAQRNRIHEAHKVLTDRTLRHQYMKKGDVAFAAMHSNDGVADLLRQEIVVLGVNIS